MILIEEIQNAAVDSKCDLGTLLRKCKVLASRLGSKPLEDWLFWESNGYPEDVEVPDYRIWRLEIKGHFFGPFGSGIKYAPIPMICLPEKARKLYEKYKCRQSIAAIEEALKKIDKGPLQVSTGDLAVLLGTDVYEGQNCAQAWAEFASGNLVELLNAVRNRILDFALAIWKEEPMVGEIANQTGGGLKSTKVTQIFNTTVYGGSANLVGSASDATIEFNVNCNDFESLERLLSAKLVSDEDIKDLREALQKDTRPTSKQGFGPSVSSWVARMMEKAANGSWKIGIGAAGTLLAQAISKYYGLL